MMTLLMILLQSSLLFLGNQIQGRNPGREAGAVAGVRGEKEAKAGREAGAGEEAGVPAAGAEVGAGAEERGGAPTNIQNRTGGN